MRLKSCIFILVVAGAPYIADARVFFAGSNPSMTVFAFPQDIWLMPADYFFFMTTWQKQPWWGDIDQPDLRPSPTYLLTGEKIGVKGSGSYFKHDANLYNWKNIVGLCREMSPTLKLRFDLDYTFMPMRAKAQGEAGSLAYDYKEGHSIQDVYLTSYLATFWRSIPVGFKFGMGRQASTEPDVDWTINNNGTTSQAQRIMWAWSTLQGSDVLGRRMNIPQVRNIISTFRGPPRFRCRNSAADCATAPANWTCTDGMAVGGTPASRATLTERTPTTNPKRSASGRFAFTAVTRGCRATTGNSIRSRCHGLP